MSVTCSPRASSSAPIEDAARPLPRLETTPPVTKMYLGIRLLLGTHASGVLLNSPSIPRWKRAYHLPPADRRALLHRHRFRVASPAALQLISWQPDPESV